MSERCDSLDGRDFMIHFFELILFVIHWLLYCIHPLTTVDNEQITHFVYIKNMSNLLLLYGLIFLIFLDFVPKRKGSQKKVSSKTLLNLSCLVPNLILPPKRRPSLLKHTMRISCIRLQTHQHPPKLIVHPPTSLLHHHHHQQQPP